MKNALAQALSAKGYDTLTPVQQAVTDPELGARDLLVSAQTGSGKTVGFGLAIAPTLLGEAEAFERAAAPLALVIAPTRELALQVKRELGWLYQAAGVQMASCVGGMDMRDERRTLERGAHIVVATPGRLRDHIMRGSINLSEIRAVVLDEADEMLDLGFQEDLEFILGSAPETRRTLMFSATVPRGIANLAGRYQTDAERLSVSSNTPQHADIDYRALSVAPRDVENAIINVLRFYEAPNALVFGNTRAMVNRLTTRLSNRGFQVVALSGELSQAERAHALQAMRDGRARVCVATDVAARGIDLPNLDLVVHAELPTSHETLLHRSGRTGRAGRKGVSALIVPPAVRKKCERLLRFAKLQAEWTTPPGADDVTARDHERMLADPLWSEAKAPDHIVATLVESYSHEQLAAAFAHLYATRHSAPEELSAPGDSGRPEPRAAFGPSQWFAVAGGRKAGIEPRRMLPMLCKAGNLSRDDIGAIRVQDGETYVELREASVAGFLSTLGDAMLVEGSAVRRMDAAPDRNAPYAGKPARAPRHAKTDRPAPPPSAQPAQASDTPPIDWNDAPAPRVKKPKSKPAAHNDSARSDAKPKAKYSAKPPRPTEGKRSDGPKSDRKFDGKPPRKSDSPKPERKSDGPRKPDAGKPARKFDGAKPAAPKRKKSMAELAGAPPVGKAGSKKNRARAKLIQQQRAKGGDQPPRRKP
ncbi:MAG: DEAD/DEAH box helicase [Sedimentitalea sp.]